MRCEGRHLASHAARWDLWRHRWYPGTIVSVDEATGASFVHYDDGDVEEGVLPRFLRPPPKRGEKRKQPEEPERLPEEPTPADGPQAPQHLQQEARRSHASARSRRA